MAETRKIDIDIPLTEKEKASLRYLEYAFSCQNKSEEKDALEILKSYSQQQLVRLIRDPGCNHLKRWCDTSEELQENWKEKLRSSGLPDITVESRTEPAIRHSLLHHYVSEYLVELFVNYKASQGAENQRAHILNELCDKWGSYVGLSMRSEFNCKLLSRSFSAFTSNLIDDLVRKIDRDAKSLADLYGQLGYMKAGFLHLKLANMFLESKSDEDRNRGKIFYEEAQKDFICASLLEGNEYSEKLMNSITKGKGILSIFKEEKNIPFSGWPAFKQDLMKLVGRDTYVIIANRAQNEMKISSPTPQVVTPRR